MDCDGRGGQGRRAVTAAIIAVILGILVMGVILKLAKIAIILALCVGIFMVAQNKLGAKRLK
jgi:hypothetical protein